jgi:hypothetical protein
MGAADSMAVMEGIADTIFVPPLVDETVLARFCQAVQSYADSQGLHDAAAEKLAELQLRLSTLRNLASLSRLALVGHPLSFARLEDEMRCLTVDFPCGEREPCDQREDECADTPREQVFLSAAVDLSPGSTFVWQVDFPCGERESDDQCEKECADTPREQVFLSAAVDLLAGATFVWKDDTNQRDRTIVAIVRGIEEAIAFPVTYAAEAATFLGVGTIALSPTHAAIVIGNATQRLIQSDRACTPQAPADIRRRLEGLACTWMRANPVTAFFDAIRGPKIHRIVRWQATLREAATQIHVGDPVTLLLHTPPDEDDEARACRISLQDYGVVFTPRQRVPDPIVVDNGFQVSIPDRSRSGPVIVIPKLPDFTSVVQLLNKYRQQYPDEMNSSVFAAAHIDTWAFPIAYRYPCVTIALLPTSAAATAFTASGPLAAGQTVSVGETVSIQYRIEPPGADGGAAPVINAPGGLVTRTGRPDVLLFRPSAPGNTTVQLAWGTTTVTIPINVV